MNANEQQAKTGPAPGAAPRSWAHSHSRRRMLRAGTITVPTLLALKSTPVLAVNCRAPSGFSVSGNLSQTGLASCSVPTSTPSAWREMTSGKPKVYTGTSWQPTDLFGTDLHLATTAAYKDKTLRNILNNGDGDPQALVVACFLQATVSGSSDASSGFPNTATIVSLWNGYLNNSYTASAGVNWDQTKILAYLRYLTGQS